MEFTTLTNLEKQALIKKAYTLGYEYEQKYGNCSQCTIAAIQDTFGIIDDSVFKQSYGFGAGIGLTSKGTCGAISAGVLMIGALCGREKVDFHSGRNAKCYQLSKQLMERVEEKFGGLLCHQIQKNIMGNSFDLNNECEFKAFEEAGGHDDKCPSVIGTVASYIAEMIVDGEL